MTVESGMSAQIEARKKEAEDNRIQGKASLVALFLGTARSLNDNREKIKGKDFTFQSRNLRIVWRFGSGTSIDDDWRFNSLVITYKDKIVYDQGGGTLESYIPGIWEDTLNSLLKKALLAKQEQKANETFSNAEHELRQKWGL